MESMTLFTKIPGVQLKIPKGANVQCHKVCTSSAHYELADMYTDLNIDRIELG